MIRALVGISDAHKEKELKTEQWDMRGMHHSKGGINLIPE
jgi:hypothetical protein